MHHRDRSKWLSTAAVTKMLQDHGFTNIGAIKANDGKCYVVQATDQGGAKKDPLSGPNRRRADGME